MKLLSLILSIGFSLPKLLSLHFSMLFFYTYSLTIYCLSTFFSPPSLRITVFIFLFTLPLSVCHILILPRDFDICLQTCDFALFFRLTAILRPCLIQSKQRAELVGGKVRYPQTCTCLPFLKPVFIRQRQLIPEKHNPRCPSKFCSFKLRTKIDVF